jgi:drug/metabolite transporter (DMT)-like permease
MATKLWAISLMFFTTFLTSTAQIFYKFGVETITLNLFALITNVNLLIGLFLYAVGGGLMIISFRGGEVSVLYPIVATSYIWVSFLSIAFLNEFMNVYKWLGVSVIFMGIVFIGYGSKHSDAVEGAGVI